MNVLFDTNVVLDVLLDRAPHADTAAKLFALVDNGRLDGSICSTTVTTIHYIAARSCGRQGAREQVRRLLGLFRVAHVDRAALDGALYLDLPDYEDAVVHEAARGTGAEAIVTRDRAGFAHAEIPAIDPEELLTVIAVQGRD